VAREKERSCRKVNANNNNKCNLQMGHNKEVCKKAKAKKGGRENF
jgi:hypothetical protein